jgi:hypothetical protein
MKKNLYIENNNYNKPSFYIIQQNDSHRICPSLVQLSAEFTLRLPVKICKHRFLKKLQLFSADSFYILLLKRR